MAITKVTNSLVATNAIQGTLIADNAITSVHIAQNQVTAVQIPDGSITSTQIAANSIDTAELVTGSIDTIHIGDSQVTTAKIADSNVTTGKIANNAITAAKIPDGSITETQLSSSATPTFGNITTTGSLRGPASFTIDPAAVGDNTGTVVIAGSLQVDGTTTTVNSTQLAIADKKITVATGAGSSSAANESGIEVGVGANGASSNPSMLYLSSGDEFRFNKSLYSTNSYKTGTSATFVGQLTNSGGKLRLQSDADRDIQIGDTNNEGIIYVDTSEQKVGIGTNGPGRKLHIKDNGQIKLESTSSGGWVGLDFAAGIGTYDGYMGMLDSNGIFFIDVDSNGNDLVILQNGNVGIGTNDPQGILHIDKGSADDHFTILEAHSAGDVKLIFSQGQTAGNWGIGYDDGGGVTENSFSFAYKADGYPSLSGQNKMILTPAGNLGIGDTSPDNKLTIRAASTIGTVNGHIMLTGDGATNGEGPQIVFSESGVSSDFAGAYIGHARTGGNSVGDLIFGTRATSGDANTVPTERLRIFSTGLSTFTGPASQVNLGGGSTGSSALYVNSTSGHTGEMLQILKNGSTRMEMSNAGKLGIGVSGGSVASKLHVRGTQSNTITAANAFAAFDGTGGDGIIIGARISSPFEAYIQSGYTPNIGTSHHYPLVLNPHGGNVGIGALNPQAKLHLESGNAHNKLSITSTASGGTGYDAVIDLLGSASNSEVQLNMGINGDADREQIKTYQSVMSFRTNNTEAMTIGSNGKVALHGNSANWNETTQGQATGTLHLDPDGTSDHIGNAITWGASDTSNGTNAQAGIYVRSDGSYGTKMYIATTDSYASGSKTSIKIDHAGRVTTPRQPAFQAYLSSGQSITSTETTVAFNVENFDRAGNHSNGVFTAPVDGVYTFGVNFLLYPFTGGIVNCRFYINSSAGTVVQHGASNNSHTGVSMTTTVSLSENDTVTFRISGSGLSSTNVYGGQAYWHGHLVG